MDNPRAAGPAIEKTGVPQAVVIVPGVIETLLTTDPDAGREGWFFYPLTVAWKQALPRLLFGGAKALLRRDYGALTTAALKLEDAALGRLSMAPDGTSVFKIQTPVSGAKESAYAAMRRNGTWGSVGYGAQIAPDLARAIGAENVFVFTYDWRLGSPTLTERFRDFLLEVKAVSGCEKAQILCDSYGCQIVAMYLSEYGGADLIGRIVFDSPAWTGTTLFRCMLEEREDVRRFNLTDMARVALNFARVEPDLPRLARLLPDRIVQNVAFSLIRSGMTRHLLAAPGLWCCCAAQDYDEMKEKLLDPVKHAAVIREVDQAQYGVMRRIPEILAQAREDGIALSVIMNEGTQLFAGKNVNGDGVINAANGSGSDCLPLGQTFENDRHGARVSPAHDYDLTHAFLPERTWVFYGQTHGQSHWDDASRALVLKLLLTDEPRSVDADPAFPQFSDSHCPAYGVSLRLETGGGSALRPAEGPVRAVIRNDSEKHPVRVVSVTVKDLPYAVSDARGPLKPGETRALTLTPSLNWPPRGHGSVSIRYLKKDVPPFLKIRTQYLNYSSD